MQGGHPTPVVKLGHRWYVSSGQGTKAKGGAGLVEDFGGADIVSKAFSQSRDTSG